MKLALTAWLTNLLPVLKVPLISLPSNTPSTSSEQARACHVETDLLATMTVVEQPSPIQRLFG